MSIETPVAMLAAPHAAAQGFVIDTHHGTSVDELLLVGWTLNPVNPRSVWL